jgi:hypothetical protein
VDDYCDDCGLIHEACKCPERAQASALEKLVDRLTRVGDLLEGCQLALERIALILDEWPKRGANATRHMRGR